jgi:hypothetical protein
LKTVFTPELFVVWGTLEFRPVLRFNLLVYTNFISLTRVPWMHP